MQGRLMISLVATGLLSMYALSADAARAKVPDLSGTYDIATVTPVQRPAELGDKLTLSDEEANTLAATVAAAKAAGLEQSDPDREAPPAGGDGSPGAAGNVGGYNSFWIDNGDTAIRVDGEFRTSIIVAPANGRYPEMTPAARMKVAKIFAQFRQNTGEAWWVGQPGAGPYDDPEILTLSDRCLLGFGSSGGPPTLPVLYNNLKRIVQTPDHVMILNEMVHDARIIRLNSEHVDPSVRKWMGDSIGWWEGDTLVVDTTNFKDQTALFGASRDLHVVERFKRLDDATLMYSFTVEDPNTWASAWSGEYPWPASDDLVYEYACHEGNHAMGGILRGARLLESEAQSAGSSASGGD